MSKQEMTFIINTLFNILLEILKENRIGLGVERIRAIKEIDEMYNQKGPHE